MTTVNIPQAATPAIPTNRWVRNGKYPDCAFQSLLQEQANQVARWRMKEVASFSCPIAAIPAFVSASSRARWRFAFHSSPKARSLWMHSILAHTFDEAGFALDPYALLLVETSSPTTVGTAEHHFGATNLGFSDTPAYFGSGIQVLRDGGSIATIPADTDLFGVISDEGGARILAATIYETSLDSDTSNGYLAGPVVAQGPIFDSDRGSMTSLLRTAWKSGGAHLVNWSVDDQSSPRSRTSATAINVIDNSSTAVSAASPGWTLDLQHKSTVRRVTVPVTVKIRAKQSAGTGVFRLKDSGGTDVLSISINSSTEQWWSGTANLPATVAKYDPTLESDNVNTASLYAVSIYQHEA